MSFTNTNAFFTSSASRNGDTDSGDTSLGFEGNSQDGIRNNNLFDNARSEYSEEESLDIMNLEPRLSDHFHDEEVNRRQYGSQGSDDSSSEETTESNLSQSNLLENQTPQLATKETRQLSWIRAVLMVGLIAAFVLVGFAVYNSGKRAEADQFATQYGDHIAKLETSVAGYLTDTIDSFTTLAIWFTQGDNLPFVTISPIALDSTGQRSPTEYVSFAPLVSSVNRITWEQYTQEKSPALLQEAGFVLSSASTSSSSSSSSSSRTTTTTSATTKNSDRDSNRINDNIFDPNTRRRFLNKQEIIVEKRPPSSPTDPPSQQDNDDDKGSDGIQKPPVNPNIPISGGNGDNEEPPTDDIPLTPTTVSPFIYRMSQSTQTPIVEPYRFSETYLPLWQASPLVPNWINYNLATSPNYADIVDRIIQDAQLTFGPIELNFTENELLSDVDTAQWTGQPFSRVFFPAFLNMGDIFDQAAIRQSTPQRQVLAGVITAIIPWQRYLEGALPKSSTSKITAVLEARACDGTLMQQFSLGIRGPAVNLLGSGDLHDRTYDRYKATIDISQQLQQDMSIAWNSTTCSRTIQFHFYPTLDMEEDYETWRPLIYTISVFTTFLFTCLVFGFYDWLVERRNKLVMETAVQSSAVVSSLFPAVVRDRLFPTVQSNNGARGTAIMPSSGNDTAATAKRRLKYFLDEGPRQQNQSSQPPSNTKRNSTNRRNSSKPIADLFPETTVLFADIAGFTAWSSVREPSQVFTLLETIYHAFDTIAKKRKVFKVETIGDCYVAVTGLPEPQKDHAIIMAKFAMECMIKMNNLSESLEVTLGPDTGDLEMRFGLHSGPVTAGVLRGEKSRFQLFGDTVNTASRMESTGKTGRIHCSQATADLIIAGGKSHWICPRDEIVQAKGKGSVQTFWVTPASKTGSTNNSLGNSLADSSQYTATSKRSLRSSAREMFGQNSTRSLVWGDSKNFVELPSAIERHKHQRLIDYNVDLLCNLLKQIVARRQRWDPSRLSIMHTSFSPSYSGIRPLSNPIHEVTEVIEMPRFDPKASKLQADPEAVELGSTVISQLKDYVTTIANMYHDDNPFHNFEHACHVTMSANKLLKRVVTPDDVYERRDSKTKLASNLHNYTYGITSDPLTQFAIVLSALIHDVDHCGVSNGQLIKERTHTAIKYIEKSVAEQNSVDLSWDLLMEPSYEDLQKCIYSNETDFKRFRNLVVNSVIATDIFDKDLKALRNKRWEKAFQHGADDLNLKATIVIEHIIQASDVSHTMQHWHVYQKWNERLFQEMYSAYRCGRGGDKDPADGWYKGELWFYDNYVIPLAKKLKECGVFGVASAECLTYALDNRREWEAKGQEIVRRMVENYSAPSWVQTGSIAGSSVTSDYS